MRKFEETKSNDMNFIEDDSKYLRAKERVEEIRKFYTSALYYVIFISFIAAINYYSNQWSYAWFLWAAFGWGISLVFQALKVFSHNLPFLGRDWEERKIKEFMNDKDTNKWA